MGTYEASMSVDLREIGITTRRIAEEVDGIYDQWRLDQNPFEPEKNAPLIREHRMQLAFRNQLRGTLGKKYGHQYTVLDKDAYPLAGMGKRALSNAFSRYDVSVKTGIKFEALLELSIDDSTVCHGLDNGEHKLLCICDGVGCASQMPFWQTRGLTPEDVAFANGILSEVSVRGLFFVTRLSHQGLDIPQEAVWTDGGFRPFRSALIRSETTTLREVIHRLAASGLFIWYYSLIDGEHFKLRPPCFSDN